MKQIDVQEKRLIERTVRTSPDSLADVRKAIDALPDLAERVMRPSEEQATEFKQQLIDEQSARQVRIARFIEEAKAPPAPRPPVTPVNEAEL